VPAMQCLSIGEPEVQSLFAEELGDDQTAGVIVAPDYCLRPCCGTGRKVVLLGRLHGKRHVTESGSWTSAGPQVARVSVTTLAKSPIAYRPARWDAAAVTAVAAHQRPAAESRYESNRHR